MKDETLVIKITQNLRIKDKLQRKICNPCH